MVLYTLFAATEAFADGAAPAAQASPTGGIVAMLPMIIAFVAIFYFLIYRPQSKQAKQHQKMLGELLKGDTVITRGGVYGRIWAIEDDVITLEVSHNVKMKVAKAAVQMLIDKDKAPVI